MLGRPRLADAALDAPPAPADDLIANLRTGDIWLSPGRPSNIAHFLIRFLTRSHWAHVGLLLRQDDEVFLIDASASHSLRIIPMAEALRLEQTEGRSVAPVVLARTAALAGEGLPGALSEADAELARLAILRRVAEGFPRHYDFREILRILWVLLRGGLVRRWRTLKRVRSMQRGLHNHLHRLVRTRLVDGAPGATAAAKFTPHPGDRSRWIWNKFRTPEAQARRIEEQDPYTCVELVVELLQTIPPYRDLFDLDPEGEDFLCPATVAERVPLVALGRVL